MAKTELIYNINDKPKNKKDLFLYSLQWIMIMFYPVVWGYSIVGLGLELTGEELGLYMVRVVFMIGVTTLVQVSVGHQLSMVSGPNIIPSLAIVAAFAVGGKDYALQSFNAYIIAGFVVAILGFLGVFSKIGKVWTPLVSGAMIMMVGLSTSAVGISLISNQGLGLAFYVGILLALICGYLSIKGKGLLASIPVLITIVLGYLIFIVTNQLDWELVRSMPVVTLPKLFPYGVKFPPIDLIIIMIIVNIFSAVNLYGNIQGYSQIVGQKQTQKDEKRYFSIFGMVEGVIASIFGVPSHVAYGENLGFVLLTRIASRIFIIIASIAFIVFSFFGNIGGLMAAMPSAVAGAVLLGVASTLIGIGAKNWHQSQTFETREIFIVGFSIFLAFGLSVLPENFYQEIPRIVGTLFKNPVITVIIIAVILEQIIFKEKKKESNNV
ncbi:MAG: purine/pyrimidine permease [Acholeplasmataceae bacterium]|nr:purine/pyrimidine permease [Acholeplasmataceae bacterium]